MTEHKATPHRAKPEVWARVESYGNKDEKDMLNCILELRARVEALEAAAKPVESNDPTPSHSLIERVADNIYINAMGGYSEQARAAINEVAMWLRERDKRVRASVEIAGDLQREIKQQPS